MAVPTQDQFRANVTCCRSNRSLVCRSILPYIFDLCDRLDIEVHSILLNLTRIEANMASRVDMAATLGETPLTIGWIEKMIVKEQQADTVATLVDWSTEIIGVGQGYAAHIYRVRLVWSETGKESCSLPSSVVVKVQ
jgi:hypothetical protein